MMKAPYGTRMKNAVSRTDEYHTRGIRTLGWELTVCNALEPPDSPCRPLLKTPDSYGHLLYSFLDRHLPMAGIRAAVEIGGGYGCLMRDFLDRKSFGRLVMVDISPVLLERQRERLGDRQPAEYVCGDFLKTPQTLLDGIELAILNENLGDFPTLVDFDGTAEGGGPAEERFFFDEARRLIGRYSLPSPQGPAARINVGALMAVEKLCLAGIPFIFIGEHSCQAAVPPAFRKLIRVRSTGTPERIPLCGHDEYTIRFSDLEDVARALGYRCRRGPFADLLEWEMTERLRRILTSGLTLRDGDEISRQFIEDLYQYEYLILTRDQAGFPRFPRSRHECLVPFSDSVCP